MRSSTNVDNLPGAMNTQLHPLDFAARQAAKSAERQAIARKLRAGVKTLRRSRSNTSLSLRSSASG